MNNGYTLLTTGLLESGNTPDTDADHTESYLPANHHIDTIPSGIARQADADDAAVWPSAGKHDRHRPDPDALAAAVHRARRAVAWQSSPELLEAKSPADLQADMDQARRHANQRRNSDDQAFADDLAEETAQRKHGLKMRSMRRGDAERVDEARYQREKILDPANALVMLDWARKVVPFLALIPALFAVLAGAVNVAAELNRINPATTWINWAIEPLFTWPLAVILLAQVLGAVPKPDFSAGLREARHANQYVPMELGLGLVAVALNVGLHWMPANHPAGALVWLFAPAGLAFSAYLVPKLITDIRTAITEWSQPPGEPTTHDEEEASSGSSSIPSGLHGKKHDEPRSRGTEEVIREPQRRGREELRARFYAAIRNGEIDPAAQSVNAIAKRLGTRWDTANTLIREWQHSK